VNAAFLLVTSALLVGQADKRPVPPPPSASVASSCCQESCGCESYGHKLRDRLRGMFSRDCSDACQPTACHTHHVHTPTFKSSCDDCAKPKFWHRQPACHTHNHCATAQCNDGCERGSFLAKLRERFSRGDRCCDTGCNTGSCGNAGCGGPVTPAPRMGEPINNPKKMPDAPRKGSTDKKPQEVRFETQPAPIAPNAIPANPTVPSVELAPAPAPRVEGDRRDPF
jgi:hypothetical protein